MKFLHYYVLFILIFIGINSNASIIFHDINDYYLYYGNEHTIDLNNDGTVDFDFYGDGLNDLVVDLHSTFQSGVVTSGGQNVYCFSYGQYIGSGGAWQNNSTSWINPAASNPFPAGSNRYIGVRVQTGSVLYGWILVEYTTSALIIKAYAYESSGQYITAGATSTSTAGIEEAEETVMTVFPNPVVDELNVSLETDGNFTATIVDINGNEILSTSGIGNTLKISTTDFPCGMYFLYFLLSDGRTLYRSFLK